MKKDFDFDDIGKRTPYRTPEGFFEDMQRKVIERTGMKQQRKSHLTLIVSTIVATAAIIAGILFIPSLHQSDLPVSTSSNVLAIESTSTTTDAEDKWIIELTDEELEELVNFSEIDIFLN